MPNEKQKKSWQEFLPSSDKNKGDSRLHTKEILNAEYNL